MRRICLIAGILLALGQAPAHALFGDEAILAMQYAEDKTFHAFMQIQMVQQLITLKQNYEASVRYLNEFKQLNSGKGIFQNIAAEVKSGITEQDRQIQQQINQTFIQSSGANNNTAVDQLYKSLNQGIANNIRYAGDEMANVIANRKNGQQIATSADGLAPKDAANLSAKAGGIQIQMLSQIHEDSLRLIQLASMQLSAQTREQQSQSRAIDSIRQSIQRRYPNAGVSQEDAQ